MTFGLNEIFDQAKTLGVQATPASPQDIIEKIASKTLKSIQSLMEAKHYFDWTEFNVFGTGEEQVNDKDLHMTRSDMLNMAATLRNVPLKEFVDKSGAMTGAGLQGVNYLIPIKIYDILFTSAIATDIVAQMSRVLMGPAELPGTTCNVDFVTNNVFNPTPYSSGGKMPESNLTISQAVLDFSTCFGLHIPIGYSMIEDSQWSLMERSLEEAGKEMGEYATNAALTILYTAPDGDGTQGHGHTNSTSLTLFQGGTVDVEDAMAYILGQGYTPNTVITSPHCGWHTIVTTPYNYAEPWAGNLMANGLPSRMAGMDMLYTIASYIAPTTAATPLNGKTIVIDKQYALISGRKRWLKIDKYTDPIQDLVGATISSRQDSVTIQKNSCFTISEEAT